VPSACLVACVGAAQSPLSARTESFSTVLGPLWGPSQAPHGPHNGSIRGLGRVKPASDVSPTPPAFPRRLPRSPWDSPAVPTCPQVPSTVPMGPGYGAQGGLRTPYGAHGPRLRCPKGSSGALRCPTVPMGPNYGAETGSSGCPGGPTYVAPGGEGAVRGAGGPGEGGGGGLRNGTGDKSTLLYPGEEEISGSISKHGCPQHLLA